MSGYSFVMLYSSLSSLKRITIYSPFPMQHLALDLESNNLQSFKPYPSARYNKPRQLACQAFEKASCFFTITALLQEDYL